MTVTLCENREALGALAAREGAWRIRRGIEDRGASSIVVATGKSQFETLDALVSSPGIDWSRVDAFHLDEYVGIRADHPASFRRYLRERFHDRLPRLRSFRYIRADAADLEGELRCLDAETRDRAFDVAFLGIGENGHLAFNDPPADFGIRESFILVRLDRACRLQQVGEGWFRDLSDVPERAISMSVRRILACRSLIVSVPDARKARAVEDALRGPIRPECPASALQSHPDCHLLLDPGSASGLIRIAGADGDAEMIPRVL